MPDTRFAPSAHGFHFSNTYLNYVIPGITTTGRCGGMAYAALDYFFSGVAIPSSQQRQVKGIDAVARDVDHLDLFAWANADDAVWHRPFFRNGWADWQSLGGVVASAPSASSWGPNHIDVFARGTDNALWHKSWDGAEWADWSSLGGVLTSGPDACSWGPGRIDVFARGTNNDLVHIYYDGAWHEWESLGGQIASDPSAVSRAPGLVDVYARGTDDALWRRTWDGHSWQEWATHGGTLTSAPDATSWGPGRLDVVALDSNANMTHLVWDNSWGDWQAIDTDGIFQSDPTVAGRPGIVFGPPRLDAFGVGTDGQIWQNHFESGWRGWRANAVDVAGDSTALGDFIYRRQITSLVNQGPGFVGRLMPWNSAATQFSWGVSDGDELGRLRAALDAGRPVPLGLINVQPDLFAHHQVVAIGYDAGSHPATDLRVRIYDPNVPDVVCTLTPDAANNCFGETRADTGGAVNTWRTYFVDQAYREVRPLS